MRHPADDDLDLLGDLRKIMQSWAEPPPEMVGHLPKGGTTLDYLGHAAVTRILTEVDPLWGWEPMGRNPDGTPAITTRGKTASLWISLTVFGVTRHEVGTCDTGKPDMEKELVSDALRRAAMRFGIGLSLWSKEDIGGGPVETVDADFRVDIAGRWAALPSDLQTRFIERMRKEGSGSHTIQSLPAGWDGWLLATIEKAEKAAQSRSADSGSQDPTGVADAAENDAEATIVEALGAAPVDPAELERLKTLGEAPF